MTAQDNKPIVSDNARLWSLAEAVCVGKATGEQYETLNTLLADKDAAIFYATYLRMHGRLLWHFRDGNVAAKHDAVEMPTSFSIPVPSFFSISYHRTVGFFSQELPFSLLIATVLTSLGLWLASMVYVSSPEKITKDSFSLPSITTFDPTLKVVGKITGMVDCKWAIPDTDAAEGVRVTLGHTYALSSGLMEIAYDTGAKVILQGPVVYEVDSSNGGFIAVGKLTARLEKKVAGGQWLVASESDPKSQNPEISKSQISSPQSLIPNPFVIRTPTALVTDLGTEFAVEVDRESGSTISHVFRGSVELRAVAADGKVSDAACVLHASQTACVEKCDSRQGGKRVKMIGAPANLSSFAREVRVPAVKMFDLVDAVAGGDGFSGKRNASIDPITGRRSTSVKFENSAVGKTFPSGDGKYHHADGLPFVDGVFVPDGSSGPVQVDSAGHVFAECPESSNQAPASIWAGGTIPSIYTISTTLGGIDYSKPGHGLLYMHPDNGITFDLDAIRKANPRWTIQKFLATAGNVKEEGGSLADIWVLVDGQLRFQRWQINSLNGHFSITVPIKPEDRFLTLATTDGGHGLAGNWIIFGDPRLQLVESNDPPTSPKSVTEGGR